MEAGFYWVFDGGRWAVFELFFDSTGDIRWKKPGECGSVAEHDIQGPVGERVEGH